MEPKSIKKTSKNRCEKISDFRLIFMDLLGLRFCLFTFGKEGNLQENKQKRKRKEKEGKNAMQDRGACMKKA